MGGMTPIPAADSALDLQLNRRSCHRVRAPGPDDAELALILRAALRVPDFQHLRPYRFLAARDAGLDRLGRAMQRAAVAAGRSEAEIARAPRMPHRAPLVITVVASPRPSEVVPLFDQQLCAACSVLTLQLAARALGYGGLWRSGWLMYDRGFHRELGLGEDEQIVGFLYLGTPQHAEETTHEAVPDPYDVLRWI